MRAKSNVVDEGHMGGTYDYNVASSVALHTQLTLKHFRATLNLHDMVTIMRWSFDRGGC